MSQPLFFYKFVSFGRKDILENGLIRFAPIGSFNDPFELEPTIVSVSRQWIEHLMQLTPADHARVRFSDEDYKYSAGRNAKLDFYKEKYRAAIGKYGVLSLSSNLLINQSLPVSFAEKDDPRTNLLMWSHYADWHRGFVIEFYPDFIDGAVLEKVEYSEQRDMLTFEDIDENRFDRVFFKKSSEWAYEQEYRAVLSLDKAKEVRDGQFHLFEINKSRIKSICFGCAMSKENKALIMDLVQRDPKLKKVRIDHAYMDGDGFNLSFYMDDGHVSNSSELGIQEILMQKKL